jgi:hypothetical protein
MGAAKAAAVTLIASRREKLFFNDGSLRLFGAVLFKWRDFFSSVF